MRVNGNVQQAVAGDQINTIFHTTRLGEPLFFLLFFVLLSKITDVIDQAQHEGVDILAVPLGGGTGPYPDAYSVTLKVKTRVPIFGQQFGR